MNGEQSYGIIPIKKEGGVLKVLLVQLHAGHWGFPKGHPMSDETPLETASRELQEETGLQVACYLSETPFEEHYIYSRMGKTIHKTVTYFVAEVTGVEQYQAEEVRAHAWLEVDRVDANLTFKEGKRLFAKVKSHLLL